MIKRLVVRGRTAWSDRLHTAAPTQEHHQRARWSLQGPCCNSFLQRLSPYLPSTVGLPGQQTSPITAV